MEIKVDKEGQQAILMLIDCALKAGGRANMAPCQVIEAAIEIEEPDNGDNDKDS